MPRAISNTSPLLYLYRAGVLEWLPRLFSETWISNAVVMEWMRAGGEAITCPIPGISPGCKLLRLTPCHPNG